MADTVVRYVADGPVARLTIDRPEKRNALDFEAMRQLRSGLAAAKADAAIRVVVLTGAGEQAFCSGADLGGVFDISESEAHESRGELANVFRDLSTLGKPSIARVRGFALAGGFGLAMACDFVIAADDVTFGTPEINVGLWPFMITVPLLRVFPDRVLLELMMTGRRMPVAEAVPYGAVNRVVPVDELDAAVDEFAATLAAKSPLILRWGREAFQRVRALDDDQAYAHLQAVLTVTTHSHDTAEGLAAFAEKRDPQWTGT